MDPLLWLLIAAAVLIVGALVGLVVVRRRGMALPPVPDRTEIAPTPPKAEDSAPATVVPGTAPETVTSGLDVPEAPASRLVRLRRRLAGSQNAGAQAELNDEFATIGHGSIPKVKKNGIRRSTLRRQRISIFSPIPDRSP